MASIVRTISAKTDKTGKAELLLRISIDRNHKQRIKSGIFIPANRFREGEIIKPRANRKEAEELKRLEDKIVDVERMILTLCQENEPEILTKDFFLNAIQSHLNPEIKQEDKQADSTDLFEAMNNYFATSGISEVRIRNYRVLCRALARYQMYIQKSKEPDFKLTLDNVSEKTLEDFTDFLRKEHLLYDEYPEIYEEIPAITRTQRKPKKPLERGDNTIICELKRLRAFYNWSVKRGYTNNYPFSKFIIGGETYGTPYYLTIAERNIIAQHDFSKRTGLATQRDIFIFQCLVGCRVSDLLSLTQASVINGAIEYVPQKTKSERPEIVRVPLNQQAKDLIEKYKDDKPKSTSPLFPFISSQKYNQAIKEIIKLSGIDRTVTILNPTTGEEAKKPIYEVASSHMARRTFIGNLYKKVKDPNLVGSLSGHKEGSKAFARYREIDEDIKKELVNML